LIREKEKRRRKKGRTPKALGVVVVVVVVVVVLGRRSRRFLSAPTHPILIVTPLREEAHTQGSVRLLRFMCAI